MLRYLLLVATVAFARADECPENSVLHDKACYRKTQHLIQSVAVTKCDLPGEELVTGEDLDEMAAVAMLLSKSSNPGGTGGNPSGNRGGFFYWTSAVAPGANTNYVYPETNAQAKDGSGNLLVRLASEPACLAAWTRAARNYVPSDCSATYQAICRAPLVSLPTGPRCSPGNPGYFAARGYTWELEYKSDEGLVPHYNASLICNKDGGITAALPSQDAYAALKRIIPDYDTSSITFFLGITQLPISTMHVHTCIGAACLTTGIQYLWELDIPGTHPIVLDGPNQEPGVGVHFEWYTGSIPAMRVGHEYDNDPKTGGHYVKVDAIIRSHHSIYNSLVCLYNCGQE